IAIAGRLSSAGEFKWETTFGLTSDPAAAHDGWSEGAAGIVDLPDGRLLVGGSRTELSDSSSLNPTREYGAVRLLPEGGIDESYGIHGGASRAARPYSRASAVV